MRGLEAIYRIHSDAVYRVCLRVLGSASEAEDATQEVFLRVFEKASTFSGRSQFSTWLHRVAVNHCLNAIQKRERNRTLPLVAAAGEDGLPSSEREPLEIVAAAEERELLDVLLDQLRPDHRAVLVLREIEGLSYREIADVVQIPIGTVMSRLSRARECLKSFVCKENGDPHQTGSE